MTGKTQWYIGAPNGVVLCIHKARGGSLEGLLYHSYDTEPVPFVNTEQMTGAMEKLYDELRFPYPSNSERVFIPTDKAAGDTQKRSKIMSDEKLLSKHGDLGTFIVRVQHRQNSSWQGRITWMEEDKTLNFRSVWEMIKLIENAVDTVSVPEDDEAQADWFQDDKA